MSEEFFERLRGRLRAEHLSALDAQLAIEVLKEMAVPKDGLLKAGERHIVMIFRLERDE